MIVVEGDGGAEVPEQPPLPRRRRATAAPAHHPRHGRVLRRRCNGRRRRAGLLLLLMLLLLLPPELAAQLFETPRLGLADSLELDVLLETYDVHDDRQTFSLKL